MEALNTRMNIELTVDKDLLAYLEESRNVSEASSYELGILKDDESSSWTMTLIPSGTAKEMIGDRVGMFMEVEERRVLIYPSDCVKELSGGHISWSYGEPCLVKA